jgi:hypothetical protein
MDSLSTAAAGDDKRKFPFALHRRSTVVRKIVRLLLTFALCTGAAIVVPVPASAAVGDLTCTATAQANFSPPLTLAGGTVDVDVTGAFTNCLSLNGNYAAINSGTFTGKGVATAPPGVPCSLLITITGSVTVDWSPPPVQDSKLDFAIDINPLDGTVELTGGFTQGTLAGDSVAPVPSEFNPNPDCAITGDLEYVATSLFVAVIG